MIRATQKQAEERCAICRDGPEGLVICRSCKTLAHAACLIENGGGCPTLGCGERDPLAGSPKRGPLEKTVSVSIVGGNNSVAIANAGSVAINKAPPCAHSWNVENYQCFYCGISVEEMARQQYGSVSLGRYTPTPASRKKAAEILAEVNKDLADLRDQAVDAKRQIAPVEMGHIVVVALLGFIAVLTILLKAAEASL